MYDGGGNPKRILFSQLSWAIFFSNTGVLNRLYNDSDDDGGGGGERIGLSYIRSRQDTHIYNKCTESKGPWELDHLCGLPRAVFTLRQHPAGFLFTPENPANRNLGARRRVYIMNNDIYVRPAAKKPSINSIAIYTVYTILYTIYFYLL